jgi:hypothetical protein
MWSLAHEVREVRTHYARVLWRHPTWAALYGWFVVVTPDCDPVLPALHAIREARIGHPSPPVERIARRATSIAHKNPRNRCWDEAELWPQVPVPPAQTPNAPRSIVPEVAELFRRAGISPADAAWDAISTGVDIGIDWLDEFASNSKLRGDKLIAAARDARAIPSRQRLRAHFYQAEGRPLVALLLGGDQWGSVARLAAGCEASLLLWALKLRHANEVGEPEPVPPPPVVKAWATTCQLIEAATAGVDSLGSTAEDATAA